MGHAAEGTAVEHSAPLERPIWRSPSTGGSPMKTSTDRILTTHVGSLARPTELLDTMKEKENGRPYDADLYARQITEALKHDKKKSGKQVNFVLPERTGKVSIVKDISAEQIQDCIRFILDVNKTRNGKKR